MRSRPFPNKYSTQRHSLDKSLTSLGLRHKCKLCLRQPFLIDVFCNDKLFLKRHWRNVAIVRLIFAQKVIAIKCHTKSLFDVPVWRPVGVSTVGLWTCRCIDLSVCRPVGVSACRHVDLSVCRPVGNRPVGNRPVNY